MNKTPEQMKTEIEAELIERLGLEPSEPCFGVTECMYCAGICKLTPLFYFTDTYFTGWMSAECINTLTNTRDRIEENK